MVAVALTDGLANRMFQYAFGVGLKSEGIKVLYDKCHYRKKIEQTWEFVELTDAFPNIDIDYTDPWSFFLTFPGYLKGSSLFIKLFGMLGMESVVIEPSLAYMPNIKNRITRKTLFYGHWQSELYFDKCVDAVRSQFTFLPFCEEKNIACSTKMSREESVAIHVRKGEDYSRWISTHGICERDYYLRGISYVKRSVNNPVFYVFTDNPQWVKDNFADIEYTLVDWNPVKGKYNFRDMQLMSCAKHNIIANSTYSWWGAWLNNNPNKIVIAPERWVNGSEPSLIDNSIIPDRWIKM